MIRASGIAAVAALLLFAACDTKPPASKGTGARALPALDMTCTSDADCALFDNEIADAPPRTYACCSGCTGRTANRASLEKFLAACQAAPPPTCPDLGCIMPALQVSCRSGRCETAPKKESPR